jgi:hypothetical protein
MTGKIRLKIACAVLISLGLGFGCSYLHQNRSWGSKGAALVTDHRDIPVRGAETTKIMSGLDAPSL